MLLSLYDKEKPEYLKEALTSIFEQTVMRSEEHTSELQSLARISYAVFCLKKKKKKNNKYDYNNTTKTQTKNQQKTQ